jgi:hypothetical protein
MIFDKILPLIPTQAAGIVLAALAIWWIEPATAYGMAVLGVLVVALVNAVKQAWDWLAPKFARRAETAAAPKLAKPAPLKPKRKRERSA